MPLQIDATTRYATGNYTKPLTRVAAQLAARRTTRGIHKGLPPTPIGNPGHGRDPGRRPPGADELPVLRRQAVRQRRAVFTSNYQQFLRRSAAVPARARQRGGRLAQRTADTATRSSRTRLGVLGWPVAHSRSPAMQNAALAAVGLADWRYQLLPVPPELFAETVRGAARRAGFRGANVTIPHKEAALAVATDADRARAGDRRREHARVRCTRRGSRPTTPTRPG